MNDNPNEPISVELTRTAGYFRLPCTVCGGWTEKNLVAAEAREAWLRVCESCLEAGDIDTRLQRHADALERQAVQLRSLVGHLRVPTFADWQAAVDEEESLVAKEHGLPYPAPPEPEPDPTQDSEIPF